MHLLLHGLLSNNQFASGGLLLMVIGGVAAYLRKIPADLWHALTKQFTLELVVSDDDASFIWVKQWFMEQPFIKRVRQLDLNTANCTKRKRWGLLPAPGKHWLWRGFRPFHVIFDRSTDTKGWSPRRTENLKIKTWGRKQEVLHHLVNEIVNTHLSNYKGQSKLFKYEDSYWSLAENYRGRSIDTVVLPLGEKERLLADIQKFLASEEKYRALGIPYHRGYLFYGIPGSGKSSLAAGIADHFGFPLYMLNLSQFTDDNLRRTFSQIVPHSVVLMEDVDCMHNLSVITSRSKDTKIGAKPNNDGNYSDALADRLGVSMSGLLNALDGVDAPDSVIFIMTTNRIETLEPALIRPGRIDYKLHLGEATHDQKINMAEHFYPQLSASATVNYVQRQDAKSMADFQNCLLQNPPCEGILA